MWGIWGDVAQTSSDEIVRGSPQESAAVTHERDMDPVKTAALPGRRIRTCVTAALSCGEPRTRCAATVFIAERV
jgi:hypothetical protein